MCLNLKSHLNYFQNQGDLVKPIHVVVSLGTGCIPKKEVKTCDVYRPEGLFDIAKVAIGANALGQLLIDQVIDLLQSYIPNHSLRPI